MCIDYRKLNAATRKGHFVLSFIDEMLERLAKHSFFCYLDGYLGHAGFYRRFIKNFSHIARPLTNLWLRMFPLRSMKNASRPFIRLRRLWSQPQSFSHPTGTYLLKSCVMQATSLLEQYWSKDKKHHAISYARKTLTGPQLNYSTTEKELLAAVFAIDKFRSYLVGSKVIIYTDHAALKYLLTKKDAKPRLIRNLISKSEIKKGVKNSVADHLSRMKFEETSPLPIDDYMRDDQLLKVTTA
ncbi:LOW QUALITY PROTEIN: hypothetical protein U9M48_013775 [Paspalum notatum var. saurae]|uniref:Reverse transcriptase RNase H-like domain-containing protein n=1 Tax=Paspalum notatum var. saurae TaxID=547442 RepID=A0AAQ3T066_PASNO